MRPDDEPKTDAELITRLFALYAAGDHSGGARDDFWDTVSFHIGWILDLAKRGAKRNAKRKPDAKNGGLIRAANLSPERRSEIAKQAANARWSNPVQRPIIIGKVTGAVYEGDQVPGMPGAICHACGLKDYPCTNVDCPNAPLSSHHDTKGNR